MRRIMNEYGGFIRMFLMLGLAICIIIAIFLYGLWEIGDWPVLKSFPSPDGEHSVELVDWDTAGFFQTGEGSYVHFRHGSGSFGGLYNWEDIDVQWAPDGANLFLTIETVEGDTEYRIVEQKEGENPDGVGSWGSHKIIPSPYADETDLQAVLTEACKAHSGFLTGWEQITFLFIQWGEDSETITFQFTTEKGDVGFIDYHYPTGEITRLYE